MARRLGFYFFLLVFTMNSVWYCS